MSPDPDPDPGLSRRKSRLFPRSRQNRDSSISRNPGRIGIGAKSRIFSRSRPNWDRGKIPNIFPIPAQSGSGKSRLFSRPNRGGTGRGFNQFGDHESFRPGLARTTGRPSLWNWTIPSPVFRSEASLEAAPKNESGVH